MYGTARRWGQRRHSASWMAPPAACSPASAPRSIFCRLCPGPPAARAATLRPWPAPARGCSTPAKPCRACAPRKNTQCAAAAATTIAWVFTMRCSSKKTTSPPRARSPPPWPTPAVSHPPRRWKSRWKISPNCSRRWPPASVGFCSTTFHSTSFATPSASPPAAPRSRPRAAYASTIFAPSPRPASISSRSATSPRTWRRSISRCASRHANHRPSSRFHTTAAASITKCSPRPADRLECLPFQHHIEISMRASQLLLATVKETPADAEVISHQLMLRAGMIRKLAAGLYTWLPLGLRVLRKVEAIVREEMNEAGAQEVLMPAIQPAELWQESGRWEQYGGELLRLRDRHQREFCFGPTHEEVITDLIRREVRSYKQLPANFYQIQTKFRDETRPRFGVMRAREFLMKDAYSFHLTDASLKETYEVMYQTYTRIFTRLGQGYRAARAAATQAMESVATPNQHSIDDVSGLLKIPAARCANTLLVQGRDGGVVALVLRGDHQLNAIKAEKLPQVAVPLAFASAEHIRAAANCNAGSLGPVNLAVPVIADRAAAALADFVCGANVDGRHLTGVDWGRDLPEPQVADIRNVIEGDLRPDGQGTLAIKRGIEVGHLFQLGTKYSTAMNAHCLDENGQAVTMTMGCYGIGVSRVVAAAIEQNHDANGIIWPAAIAPFQVVIVPISMHKSTRQQAAAEALYRELRAAGIDTLFDDRKERAGVMIADAELIGNPHRLVMRDRRLATGELEYNGRRDSEHQMIPLAGVVDFIKAKLS